MASGASWPGRAVRLLIDGKEWQQPDIVLYTSPVRALRLTPNPSSGGLGGAPTLSIGLTAEQLVFLARGAGPFTLAVGRDTAPAAELPAATLMPGYGSKTAPPISEASPWGADGERRCCDGGRAAGRGLAERSAVDCAAARDRRDWFYGGAVAEADEGVS